MVYKETNKMDQRYRFAPLGLFPYLYNYHTPPGLKY